MSTKSKGVNDMELSKSEKIHIKAVEDYKHTINKNRVTPLKLGVSIWAVLVILPAVLILLVAAGVCVYGLIQIKWSL